MKSAKQYRELAHEQVQGYTKTLALITLIIGLIAAVVSFTLIEYQYDQYGNIIGFESKTPLGILELFIMGPIAWGLVIVSSRVYYSQELKVKTVFEGFKVNYGKAIGAYLLQGLYILGWSLISFGIVGIVKSFSYSMTYYVLEDNRHMSAKEAITESRRLMNGHKWQLFCLELSYLGWMLLSVLTFGILYLWVAPKINQAIYNFYLDLKEERL